MTKDQTNQPLIVHEIYRSLQGEGMHAGIPCSFIRLTGCPLRCKWCDSAHAFAGGEQMDFAQIQKSLPKIEPNHNQTEESRPLVLVTGGEPLAQPAAFGLMQNLVDAGYKVLLETSGSEPIEKVPEPVHILLDLKCPDSKMSKHNLYENLEHLKKSDEIKFVVASKSDFDWAHALSTERGLYRKYHVLFSPAWGHVKEKDLSEWLLAINVPARLNLQQHKYIWGPRKKGV